MNSKNIEERQKRLTDEKFQKIMGITEMGTDEVYESLKSLTAFDYLNLVKVIKELKEEIINEKNKKK